MSSTGGNYGDIHRYESARESTAAMIGIVLLTVLEIAFVSLFTFGLVSGWAGTNAPYGNMYMGGLLAAIFIDLAFVLMLYRKEFLPDVMIVKKRRRKWEDLYVRQDDVDGETLADPEDLVDTLKRAIYPYYKK
jgi:hypothetical protein